MLLRPVFLSRSLRQSLPSTLAVLRPHRVGPAFPTYRKMSASAPVDAAGAAPVDVPNLQLDTVTGEMVSKRSVWERLRARARLGPAVAERTFLPQRAQEAPEAEAEGRREGRQGALLFRCLDRIWTDGWSQDAEKPAAPEKKKVEAAEPEEELTPNVPRP